MKFLRRLAVALMLAPALSPAVIAQDLPVPITDAVSDFAGVLYEAEEARITLLLTETRETTGIHMVVVTVPGLASQGGAGMRIEDYGKALFNAWGIGDPARNDGILLLLDTEAREARIALGAGYDPVYDGRAARVLSTALLPELREGRLAAGIEAAILSTRERLITPFLVGAEISVTEGFEDESEGSGFPFLAIFAGFFGLATFGIWRRNRANRTCPKCGALALTRKRETITAPTAAEAGVGLQHMTCSACGFIDRHTFAIPFSSGTDHDRHTSSGSGSDSGGFGGGSSSGGGATGKW
jgi:uncharacterized protein